MSLLRNKKAVEGLPLRYIIIALVAALVVGIALQFTGVLKVGIMSTAEKINESTTTQTTCALDSEKPVIGIINATGNFNITVALTDDCGIDVAKVYMNQGESTKATITLSLSSGTVKDGIWSGTGVVVPGAYNATVWTQDRASNPNENRAVSAQTVI